LFTLKPIEAELTHDLHWFTAMDPYIIFKLGNQTYKSSICKSGGKHPFWLDSITLVKDIGVNSMRIELWDDEGEKEDRFIGYSEVNINDFVTNPQGNQWIELTYDNGYAGKLYLNIFYETSINIAAQQTNAEITKLADNSEIAEENIPVQTNVGDVNSGNSSSETSFGIQGLKPRQIQDISTGSIAQGVQSVHKPTIVFPPS